MFCTIAIMFYIERMILDVEIPMWMHWKYFFKKSIVLDRGFINKFISQLLL